MSKLYNGTKHDYSILKNEFPPSKDWFSNQKLLIDLGFQGFVDDYTCQDVKIPKRTRKRAFYRAKIVQQEPWGRQGSD